MCQAKFLSFVLTETSSMMCLVQASRVRVFGLSRRLTRKNATKDVNLLPDRDGTAEERSEIALRDRTHRSPG